MNANIVTRDMPSHDLSTAGIALFESLPRIPTGIAFSDFGSKPYPSAMLRMRSGVLIDSHNPDPKDICLGDLAYGLSNINRYGGQTRYSVAQHVVVGAAWMYSQTRDAEMAFNFLMHDAPEYLLGDMPSPRKHLPEFEAFRALEQHVQEILAMHWSYSAYESAAVKRLDVRMRLTEQRDLLGREPRADDVLTPLPIRIRAWPSWWTERRFIAAFRKYKREIGRNILVNRPLQRAM